MQLKAYRFQKHLILDQNLDLLVDLCEIAFKNEVLSGLADDAFTDCA